MKGIQEDYDRHLELKVKYGNLLIRCNTQAETIIKLEKVIEECAHVINCNELYKGESNE